MQRSRESSWGLLAPSWGPSPADEFPVSPTAGAGAGSWWDPAGPGLEWLLGPVLGCRQGCCTGAQGCRVLRAVGCAHSRSLCFSWRYTDTSFFTQLVPPTAFLLLAASARPICAGKLHFPGEKSLFPSWQPAAAQAHPLLVAKLRCRNLHSTQRSSSPALSVFKPQSPAAWLTDQMWGCLLVSPALISAALGEWAASTSAVHAARESPSSSGRGLCGSA